MVDFIGLGAQKAGTSWLYACLYEHPELCCPQKELHFFSRDRYKKGLKWYESQFSRCDEEFKKGEFSTSYLYSREAPTRIVKDYPEAKLIAVIRNPIDRAYSQYRNAIKAGEISGRCSFEHYLEQEPSAKEQGLYGKQLYRYFQYVSTRVLLVMVYEDIEKDPIEFLKKVYGHLEVDPEFVPKSLRSRVNEARTPRFVFIDRMMHKMAEGLRKIGFDKFVWFIKKSGATDTIRGLNTSKRKTGAIKDKTMDELKEYFRKDAAYVSSLIQRDLVSEWGLEHVPKSSTK